MSSADGKKYVSGVYNCLKRQLNFKVSDFKKIRTIKGGENKKKRWL
jgi:hypothetical protein